MKFIFRKKKTYGISIVALLASIRIKIITSFKNKIIKIIRILYVETTVVKEENIVR